MTITRSKPFYAVAGAGDLAVKKLRQVPERISTLKVDRKDIENAVTTIQVETKALPGKAQGAAIVVIGEAAGRADAVYGDLVGRGRRLVTRIRRQQSTQGAQKQAGTTVRRSKAATKTAKKGAAATRSSARGTATTARKRTAATKTATKSATTSAAKTTEATAQAAGDAAQKFGS
jgi:heparin binding hemagglutinin HbhA